MTDTETHLWRAQAQLVGADLDTAQVIIPAMEGGSVYRHVPWDVVPDGIELGERFHLRCSLDPDDFPGSARMTSRKKAKEQARARRIEAEQARAELAGPPPVHSIHSLHYGADLQECVDAMKRNLDQAADDGHLFHVQTISHAYNPNAEPARRWSLIVLFEYQGPIEP